MNRTDWQQLARMKIKLGTWRKIALTKISGDRDETSIAVNAILKKSLKKDLVWILSNLDYELNSKQITVLENHLERLMNHEPLPYITGEAAFFNNLFHVTRDVLIPRPETELLVEQVLKWVHQLAVKDEINLLDIGTGSGCIPISILKTYPDNSAAAIDISGKALRIAEQNAKLSGVNTIQFIQSDLLTAVKGRFNVVTGNLPYIPTAELENLRAAKYEPWIALDGGPDGLVFYRRLFEDLPSVLISPALCIFEIHHDQGQRIQTLAREKLKSYSSCILKDYAGFDRFIKIEV